MLALKKVALTGGISSGKSTVGSLFKDQGAYVLDADVIVHQLLDHPSVQSQIIQLLGPQIQADGKINRKKVAEIVFHDFEKLNRLENMLHPLVREEVEEKFKEISKEKKWTLFVVEIPLLFETEAEKFYDATVAVIAPENQCKTRYAHKHPFGQKSFEMRVKRQLPQTEKAKRADFVLVNDGTFEDLKQAFNQMYSQLIQ